MNAPSYVHLVVERPRCPRCGSYSLFCYRSCHNGDGTRTKWTQCRECAHRFRVIITFIDEGGFH